MHFKHRKDICYVGIHSDSFLMEQFCLAQSTGCGFIALAVVSPSGCRPANIASTILGENGGAKVCHGSGGIVLLRAV